MNVIPEDIQTHWNMIRPLFLIRDEEEYDKAVERLNALIDDVGTNEQHPLYELLDTLGTVIHAYEEKHHLMPECRGVEMLKFLMASGNLRSRTFMFWRRGFVSHQQYLFNKAPKVYLKSDLLQLSAQAKQRPAYEGQTTKR